MKIQSKYLDVVTIDKSKIIQFHSGIPGFLEETEFILLDLPGNPVFQTLQSINNPELAFIVTSPYNFYPDYEFKLNNQLLEKLQIKEKEEVVVLTIVTLVSPFKSSTINLKAPIIINSNRKLGKQHILNEENYPTKALITPPDAEKAKGD